MKASDKPETTTEYKTIVKELERGFQMVDWDLTNPDRRSTIRFLAKLVYHEFVVRQGRRFEKLTPAQWRRLDEAVKQVMVAVGVVA